MYDACSMIIPVFPPQVNQAVNRYNRRYYTYITHTEWLESNVHVHVPATLL